jgi:ParB-like chromosome segregation protein Spo0J
MTAPAAAAVAAVLDYRAAEAEAGEALARARDVRDAVVRALAEAGWSRRRIAEAVGLSPARVGQLLRRTPGPRPARLGSSGLPPPPKSPKIR